MKRPDIPIQRAGELDNEAYRLIAPPEDSLPKQIEVTGEQEGLLVARVPLELIHIEDFPVDEDHVADLRNRIQYEASKGKGTGQLEPVFLGHIPELATLPIINGFHRIGALRLLGRESVHSLIYPNISWEEVLDQRIIAALTHQAVRGSRVIAWAKTAWGLTPWSQPSETRAKGLSAQQAFALAHYKNMTGLRLGLHPQEANQVREWALAKSKEWGMSPHTIETYLATAAVIDPELILAARETAARGAGAKGGQLKHLTHDHLRVLAAEMPGEENHELQRLAATAILDHSLKSRESVMLAKALAGLTPMEAEERMPALVRSILGARKPSVPRQRRAKTATQIPEYVDPLQVIYEDEIALAAFSIERAVTRTTRTEAARDRLLRGIIERAEPEVTTALIKAGLYPYLNLEPISAITNISRIAESLPLSLTGRRAFVLKHFFNLSADAVRKIMSIDWPDNTTEQSKAKY